MNKENQKLLSLVLGALLFNIVFLSEQMALNTVFFGLYIIVILFCLYPNARYSNKVRWLLAGHLLCLAMVNQTKSPGTISNQENDYSTRNSDELSVRPIPR